MTRSASPSRRRFVKLSLAAASAPWLVRGAAAADRVEESHPTAMALNYVHDAEQSDKRQNADRVCSNCQLYTGAEGDEWGPCSLFQNDLVKAAGWCSAWVAKQG